LPASPLILDGKRETTRLSLPCPDACNLAPVFNHGVLLLLCGGSSTHFFLGPEIS
jgi:hypothetical protein